MLHASLGMAFTEAMPENTNSNTDKLKRDAKKAGSSISKFMNKLLD